MAHAVVFAREYDFANKSGLRKDLSRLHSAQDLVLDMSAVTFIESSFISEFMSLIKARWKMGLSPVTVVLPASTVVREPLETTGILNVVKIVDSYSKEHDDLAPSVIERMDGRRGLAKSWYELARRVLAAWKSIRSEVGVVLKSGS